MRCWTTGNWQRTFEHALEQNFKAAERRDPAVNGDGGVEAKSHINLFCMNDESRRNMAELCQALDEQTGFVCKAANIKGSVLVIYIKAHEFAIEIRLDGEGFA